MMLIRHVEERVAREYPTDKIKSPIHLSIGQEATAAGVAAALRQDDVIFGTYRNHAIYMAKGGHLPRMVAELYGKVTGCGRGKSGSMHLVDVEAGILSASAIVGTGIPNAVGYAAAIKMQKKDNVALTFFGDGAVDEGCFYESLNFAALERLPVIFICENNGYAVYSRQLDRQPKSNITERASTIGVQAAQIDGNDALRVYEELTKAVSALRGGHGGPFLFECMTYRWREHVGPNEDFDGIRRHRAEAEVWFEKDPLRLIAAHLDERARKEIEAAVTREIEEAFAFAEASPFPSVDELNKDVFKES